jgi:hypothetical protein
MKERIRNYQYTACEQNPQIAEIHDGVHSSRQEQTMNMEDREEDFEQHPQHGICADGYPGFSGDDIPRSRNDREI